MQSKQAQAIIRKTKENYNAIASEWDISRAQPSGVKLAALKKIKSGVRILDLGCGNAFMVPYVLDRGAKYFGIDISGELIKIAKKKSAKEIKNKQVELRVGGATKLPYKNNFFDGVISFAVMHHIPSEELRLKFLQELWRVMKVGAWATVINWNVLNEWPDKRFRISEQLKNPQPGTDAGDVTIPWKATTEKPIQRYLHNFTKKELLDLARAAGFKSARAEFYRRDAAREKNGEELVLNLKKSTG